MAFLIVILSFTFKVSYLPTLVVTHVQSSGTFLMALYLVPEILMFFIIYKFINIDGIFTIESHDNIGTKIVYKTIMAILMIYFICRLYLMYVGTVMFVLEVMFENILPIEIEYTLIIPILYIAYKGIRTISRTSEILTWISVAILITNYVFLKSDLNFSENFPLLNDTFKNFIKSGSLFFFWFGDFTPLIFLTLKSSKRNYVTLSLIISVAFILFAYVIMYAMYGNSATYLSNLIVKMAGFNQFGNKLGRLDWTGIIAWLIMAILYLAIYLWATIEAGVRLINKRNIVITIIIIGLILADTLVKDTSKVILFAMTDIRYLAVLSNYLLPLILLFMALQLHKNKAKDEVVNLPTKINMQTTVEEGSE